MDIVQEWTPSESEVPADHWSKSPEYLAEKAAAKNVESRGGMKYVNPRYDANGKVVSTHDKAMSAFQVEYVPTAAELEARVKEAEKAIREDFDKQSSVYEQLAVDMITNIEKALKEKQDA